MVCRSWIHGAGHFAGAAHQPSFRPGPQHVDSPVGDDRGFLDASDGRLGGVWRSPAPRALLPAIPDCGSDGLHGHAGFLETALDGSRITSFAAVVAPESGRDAPPERRTGNQGTVSAVAQPGAA